MNHKTKIIVLVLSIAAAIVVAAIITTLLYFDYTLSKPVNRLDDSKMVVVIKQGEKIEDIAKTLHEKKLIRSEKVFGLYAKFGSAKGSLKAGTYEFSPSQSIKQITADMHNGKFATRIVVIPEGRNNKEIAVLVEKNDFVSEADFTAALSEKYDVSILSILPSGVSSLEGLLAPARYDPLITDSAHDLIVMMLQKFDETTVEFRKRTAPQNLSFYQALTLASIVELEASKTTDRKLIAGVFYNRLRDGMKLQTDPTVNYVTGNKFTTGSDITNTNSPYNTYKVNGLPPTPISNPSTNAIEAVYAPTASKYFYFIGGKDGKVYYAETYAQHQDNIKKYL